MSLGGGKSEVVVGDSLPPLTVTCMHDLKENAAQHLQNYMDSISKFYGERPLGVNVSPTKIERDITEFVFEQMDKVNAYWVEMCKAHRPHCKPQGNKILTKMIKGCSDCKHTGFYCQQPCCPAHYCHCQKSLKHQMVNFSCANCGAISEDTDFNGPCLAGICYYCGKKSTHTESNCPERIQV